ncbi:heme-binding protein [Luteimonas gilva]|uniref:Heme-binding protein n=1 Tax=Luteimonas gilva TaxID=2572684 RepID=A0A4U5JPM6_9GAMM|nr:heme-binding protein [Luteimonas gilva]TKR30786.1 heme-binding protein [Luteimonas gilva]
MKRLLPALLALAFLAPATAAENYAVRKSVNLDAAKRLVAAAEQEAAKRGLKVSIAVLDEAGRLVHFSRMDGTSNSTVDVAVRKAEHAVNFRRDTVFHQNLLEKGNNVVLGLPDSLPIEGGLMLKVGEEVVGAVGVSGAQSNIDAEIARAGMQAAGF